MQKVLTQMNVQLANVISDLSGLTGQTIVRAILAGERDPKKLAELSHRQIRASREEIAKSLEGNWRAELLFVLKQEVEMYDTYQQRIADCDRELEAHLKSFADKANSKDEQAGPESKKRKGSDDGQNGQRKLASSAKRAHGNAPHFDLRGELCRVSGVDLTRIDGIHVPAGNTCLLHPGLKDTHGTRLGIRPIGYANLAAHSLLICLGPSQRDRQAILPAGTNVKPKAV